MGPALPGGIDTVSDEDKPVHAAKRGPQLDSRTLSTRTRQTWYRSWYRPLAAEEIPRYLKCLAQLLIVEWE
jgi:hypothetical protein